MKLLDLNLPPHLELSTIVTPSISEKLLRNLDYEVLGEIPRFMIGKAVKKILKDLPRQKIRK